MFSRWVLTVASLINSFAADSRLVHPAATISRTSSSRWLSGPGLGARTRLIGRVATAGERTAWPWAAARTARRDFGAGCVLENLASRAGLDRRQHITVCVVRGQFEHPRRAASTGQLGYGGHPPPSPRSAGPQDELPA